MPTVIPQQKDPQSIYTVGDKNRRDTSSLRPRTSITSSPEYSVSPSRGLNTLELPSLFSSDVDLPARKLTVEEDDGLLINKTSASKTWPYNGPIDVRDFNIDRAAIRGEGVPTIRHESEGPQLPSEKSYITDLGAQGRIIAKAHTASVTPVPILLETLQGPTTLQDRLVEARQRIPGHTEKKGYFPEKTFNNVLITRESVKRELEICFKGVHGPGVINGYTDAIFSWTNQHGEVTSFRKIFAVLVLSEKLSSIGLFIDEEVTDRDLPLQKVFRHNGKSNLFDFIRRGDTPGHSQVLQCFKDWTSGAILNFDEWQWTTQPPFFYKGERKNVAQFRFEDQIPLPFTSDSRYDGDDLGQLEVESGFSCVFKVELHPEQHGFHGYGFSCQHFAVKCLTSRNRDEFKREANVLLKFNDETNDHLVSLLATYEQFSKFYLIFPWAEANLEEYWKNREPNPTMNHETVLWIAKQCRGLADGLARIHRWDSFPKTPDTNGTRGRQQNLVVPTLDTGENHLIGHHGDIKPQNVLWFQNPEEKTDRGTLKITDFGLSEFKASHTTFHKAGSRSPVSPSFRPPEYDLTGQNGRSHDIWALGCVYLDFVTWLLGGWDMVANFAHERSAVDPNWKDLPTDTYFEIKRKGYERIAAVKPAVKRFIRSLHGHSKCTEYLHDFLNLIEMDMLHPKPHSHSEESRIEIRELKLKLTELHAKCDQEHYALTPASWNQTCCKSL